MSHLAGGPVKLALIYCGALRLSTSWIERLIPRKYMFDRYIAGHDYVKATDEIVKKSGQDWTRALAPLHCA